MTPRRAKAVTFSLAALGVCVLLACAIAFKDPVLKEWYAWRFKTGDEAQKEALAAKLLELGEAAVVEDWYISKLEAEHRTEREAAAKKLAKLGSIRAIPHLIRILRREPWSPPGSHYSVKALQEIGSAVPALSELLNNKDEKVIGKAVYTLFTIGLPAVPALSEKLKDQNEVVRTYAAIALVEIHQGKKGKNEVVPALSALLKAESKGLRRRAAEMLGAIGLDARDAVPALVETLEDEAPRVQRAAAEALRNIRAGDDGTEPGEPSPRAARRKRVRL